MLTWDKPEPTDKQWALVQKVAEKLELDLPEKTVIEVTMFLDEYLDDYYDSLRLEESDRYE